MNVGDRVYIFGKHHVVNAVEGTQVQLVPIDSEGRMKRKPHSFDWISSRKIERRGRIVRKEVYS